MLPPGQGLRGCLSVPQPSPMRKEGGRVGRDTHTFHSHSRTLCNLQIPINPFHVALSLGHWRKYFTMKKKKKRNVVRKLLKKNTSLNFRFAAHLLQLCARYFQLCTDVTECWPLWMLPTTDDRSWNQQVMNHMEGVEAARMWVSVFNVTLVTDGQFNYQHPPVQSNVVGVSSLSNLTSALTCTTPSTNV